jgi:hypothetical protein
VWPQVTNQVFRYANKCGARYINKPKMRHYVHCYALHCLDEEAYKACGENVGAWRATLRSSRSPRATALTSTPSSPLTRACASGACPPGCDSSAPCSELRPRGNCMLLCRMVGDGVVLSLDRWLVAGLVRMDHGRYSLGRELTCSCSRLGI